MKKFENVTVAAKANVYFDGKVTSRTLEFADGSTKTLGIMLAGEYEFATGKPELMEVTAGSMRIKLAGSDEWKEYGADTAFEVEGDSSFKIVVDEIADYTCSYIG